MYLATIYLMLFNYVHLLTETMGIASYSIFLEYTGIYSGSNFQIIVCTL